MARKRLLYVVNNLAFFISHRMDLGRAAIERGWDVHVAAPSPPEELKAEVVEFGFHVVRMRRSRGKPWEELLTLVDLFRLYRRLNPDAVHLVGLKPVVLGALIARLAGIRRVVNAITGLGYLFIAQDCWARIVRGAVKALLRGVLRRPGFIALFQNIDDQSEFVKSGVVRKESSLIIRGAGVDLQRFRPSPEPSGVPLVVLVGRMLWHKGVREFVNAAEILKGSNVAARFALVGDADEGNPAAVPLKVLRGWNEKGTVEWWGHQKDIVSVLQKAHVVCLPSYREGTPKALLEAVASGRPIVTSDCPGCREVVRHYENGFLVPVGDASRLASSIRGLLEDPALRERMGKRGRQIAEQEFGLERVIQGTLRLYERG